MCEANSCGQYGKRWSCPPGCGTLEDCRRQIAARSQGILVQTVGTLEDEFDMDGMLAVEARHKAQFLQMLEALRAQFRDVLGLGAGCCMRCAVCTYPDAPCRFPQQRIASLEAYGILVSQLCRDNGLAYYYGRCSIAYTSCYLFNPKENPAEA